MKPKYTVACCAFILLFWGCAGLKETTFQPPLPAHVQAVDPEALVQKLEQVNHDLISIKGIGKIKIWKRNRLQSTRIAWAGFRLQKLRIEILGMTGRPLSSFAFDGSQIYLSLYAENRFLQKHSRRANLDQLISIPITIPDTLAILSGRVPLWENVSSHLEMQPHQDTYVLTVKKKWFGKQTAKIFLRNDLITVYRYELYGPRNKLRYRVNYLERKQYGTFQLPTLFEISDDQQTRIQITAERIWPDAEISHETFALKPPK